ncbi:hypothetical protein KTD26_24625, partial [Burkholderia multivorans]|uniref:hypothetical protein n=1 Tax=Burkholderia multivorans TaxID=87883 RepID=UPI001C21A24D
QASCGGSPWFPVREVGPGNPILSDSTGEPPPSTFNYAWDIAAWRTRVVQSLVLSRRHRGQRVLAQQARRCATGQ